MSIIATSGLFRGISNALRRHREELGRLQMQAATGQALMRVSDDPAVMNRVQLLKAQGSRIDGQVETLREARANLTLAGSVLEQISGRLTLAQTRATQAANETIESETARNTIAEEIEAILETMVSLANTDRLGVYLFAGKTTDQAPYAVEKVDGQIVAVRYGGGDRANEIDLGDGGVYPLTMPGEQLFELDNPGQTVFRGETGAVAGSGNSNVNGARWLDARHTTTDYSGAGGLVAGASSADSDTILGDHTITIDDVAKTIRLDDGPVVSYVGTETDLELANGHGDVARVDVTGVIGAYQGTVDVAGQGELSIDEGATWTAIDGGDDLAVADGATGDVLFVDTTGIVRTGWECVRVQGTGDLFETLLHLRDVLKNERGFEWSVQTDLIADSSASLEEVAKRISNSLATVGSKEVAIQSVERALDDLQAAADTEVAELEGADIVELATKIAQRQTVYELTLTTFARISSLSLLNFIS